MYSGQDIINTIKSTQDTLSICIKDLYKKGKAKAEAERDYRVALAQKMLVERDNGLPVTILHDVCRGYREIAKLKMDRDIAETLYDIVMQKIYALKIELSIAETVYKQEWGEAGRK